jgi:antirestriction protein ArdC
MCYFDEVGYDDTDIVEKSEVYYKPMLDIIQLPERVVLVLFETYFRITISEEFHLVGGNEYFPYKTSLMKH